LEALVYNTDILLLGDEVYEHILFEGATHQSLSSRSILKDRSFVCGSFGKTFHVTGWKVGYCLAPAELSAEFRKMHQFITFSTNTPVQLALADYLKEPAHYRQLPAFYEKKRNIFLGAVRNSRFKWVPSKGSFFQNLSFEAITPESDYDLAIRLTREMGVASIPLSVFYHNRQDNHLLRFCFAKDDETLMRAGEKLSQL